MVDAEKQRLASSLFGGGGSGTPSPGLRGRRAAAAAGSPPKSAPRPTAAAPDLLGGMEVEEALPPPAAAPAGGSGLDLLMGLDAPATASSSSGAGNFADPMAALAGLGGGGGGLHQISLPPPAASAASPPSLMDLGDLMSNGAGTVAAAAAPRAQQGAFVFVSVCLECVALPLAGTESIFVISTSTAVLVLRCLQG